MDIANLLEPQYIASLDDNKIVDIFLHGDNTLTVIFRMGHIW